MKSDQLPQDECLSPDQQRRAAVDRSIKERNAARAKKDAETLAAEAEQESTSVKATKYFREGMAMWGLELPDFTDPNVDNPVADTTDLPRHWMWGSFFMYQLAFYGLAAYFFAMAYIDGRTSSFITLDNSSGVCVDDHKSDKCCEVPVTITGTFRASSQGLWDTMADFDFVKNNYMATMSGVHYTNEQWTKIMKNIVSQMQRIGLKGATRDYAWNMVAWASYSAVDTKNGYFRFYTTADVGVMFDKDVVSIGFASNSSDLQACRPRITTSMSQTERVLTINTELNVGGYTCPNPPCIDNPCPGILAPQLMGYDTKYASSTVMTWKLDMSSVVTALAVNMGILPLSTLTNIAGDNDRISLLQSMHRQGSIDLATVQNTSSYFDTLYAPMNPIYCTKYKNMTQASCFVRQGDMLMYPVISHYGWSDTGLDYPTQCTAAAVGERGTAAFYYCNRFDLAVGLIYYPVENIDLDAAIKASTKGPSKNPTVMPTPGAGQPTRKPTNVPSAKPSLTFPPTHSPTATRAPTTSQRPTVRPTARPTPLPGNPTRKPTNVPSGKPSTSYTPTVSSKPSVSYKPTRPTAVPSLSLAPNFVPKPTQTPTLTIIPTVSYKPTRNPSVSFAPTLSQKPTHTPTLSKAPSFTDRPTVTPSISKSPDWSRKPTRLPTLSNAPTMLPSVEPTTEPTATPTVEPSLSLSPSETPTEAPSDAPVVRRGLSEMDQRGNRVGGKQGVTRRNPVTDHERSASTGQRKHLAKGGMDVMSSGSYYGSSSTTDSAPYDDPATSGQGDSGSSSQQPEDDDDDNTASSPFDDQKSSVGSSPTDNGPEETSNGGLVDGSSSRSDVDTLTEAELFKDYVVPTDDYKQSVSTDDFVPQVQENIDNGKIFLFAKDAAITLLAKNDLYQVTKSYPALISTIVGESGKGSSFRKDFNALCRGTVSSTSEVAVPGGCAMMAFEVFGGDNREVSTYAFQPGITPAFSNTFYNAKTMFLLAKNPPTALIETYYTCVLSQWNSFYNAAGLANSNVQLYLTVAFMVYMYLLVFYHTKVLRQDIQFKSEKDRAAAREEELRQEVLDDVIQNFAIMKMRFDALVEDSKAGDKDLTGFRHAIVMSEITDLDAVRSEEIIEANETDGEKGVEMTNSGLTETGYGGKHSDFEQISGHDHGFASDQV